MKTLIPILLISLITLSSQSHASSMFYDDCGGRADAGEQNVNVAFEGGSPYILVADVRSNFFGMKCQDLKSMLNGGEVIGAVLMPASILMKMGGGYADLAAGMADLGLAVSSTAVLSVTVIGAIGVSTVYILAKLSLNECEARGKQQLQQDIMDALQKTYGLKPVGNVQINLHGAGI